MVNCLAEAFQILFHKGREHLHEDYMGEFLNFGKGNWAKFLEDIYFFSIVNPFSIGDCKDNRPIREISSEENRTWRYVAGSRRRKSTFIIELVPPIQNKTTVFKSSNPDS